MPENNGTEAPQAPLGESLTGQHKPPSDSFRKWAMLAMIGIVLACFIAMLYNIQQANDMLAVAKACDCGVIAGWELPV